uniref:RxLR effector candidate protein n=1 Tax=Peronospora matthiolae TaxID=2874970 RepID=A0AAV1VIZ1_9STRA
MRMLWPVLTAPGICFVRCTQALIDNEPANVATISSSAIPQPDKNSSDLDSSVESYSSAVYTSASGGQRMESNGPIVDEIGHGDNEQEQRFAPMDLVSSLPASVIRAKNFVMTRLHHDRNTNELKRLVFHKENHLDAVKFASWLSNSRRNVNSEKVVRYYRRVIDVLALYHQPKEVVEVLNILQKDHLYNSEINMLFAALLSRYPDEQNMILKAWVIPKGTPGRFRELSKLEPKDMHVVSYLQSRAPDTRDWVRTSARTMRISPKPRQNVPTETKVQLP